MLKDLGPSVFNNHVQEPSLSFSGRFVNLNMQLLCIIDMSWVPFCQSTAHTFVIFLLYVGNIAGTTLTQQIVYLIMTLDFEKAVTVDMDDRFPLAELYDTYYPYYR